MDIDIKVELEYVEVGIMVFIWAWGRMGGPLCMDQGGVWEDWRQGRGLVIKVIRSGYM